MPVQCDLFITDMETALAALVTRTLSGEAP